MAGVDAHTRSASVSVSSRVTPPPPPATALLLLRRSEEDSDFFARVTRLPGITIRYCRRRYTTIMIIILYTYYNDMRFRPNSARVTLNRLCYYHRRRRHYRVIHYYISAAAAAVRVIFTLQYHHIVMSPSRLLRARVTKHNAM